MALPPCLSALLTDAWDHAHEEEAWAAFLREYSGLFLHVARAFGGDRDAVMDRYAFIIQALRADDFRRLRQFTEHTRAKFTTWLVVVLRRLCLDHHRARYGRGSGPGSTALPGRRALADLIAADVDVDTLVAPDDGPDVALRVNELKDALAAALNDLDGRDRILLRMRFEDELSVPEIARALGYSSPFVVYRRIDALLRELRKALGRAGVEDPTP